MRSRWSSVARGSVYAGVATLVAAVSHTVAGDTPPSWFGVLVTFVLAGSASTVLAGRTVSWWRLIAAVTVGQAMFHGLFAGMGTPVAVAHEHGPVALVADAHPHGMLWAHVVASAITVLALRFGESAVRSLADALRFVPRDLALAPDGPVARRVHFPDAPALRALGMPQAPALRGPPLGFAQLP